MIARVLDLQRSVGNAAVARMLSGRVLARETAYPEGKKLDSGYWGEKGKGIPADELGGKIATDLLGKPKFLQAALEVLTGYWIVDIARAVDKIRQLGKLGELDPIPKDVSRIAVVVEMIANPLTFDADTAVGKINDREYTDLTGLNRDGTPAPTAPAVTQISEIKELQCQIAMERFAKDREALLASKRPAPATPAPAGDPGQPAQSPKPGPEVQAVAEFDAKNLPLLEALTAKRKGPRWAHKNEAVTTAILAALQLRAVNLAMGQLVKGEGATASVHDEVRDGKNKDYNWCGMFAAHELIAAGMAGKHVGALDSTSKVHAFFNYTAWHPDVVKTHIKDDDGKIVPVKDYHTARHSTRTWIPTAHVGDDNLDIRPGDVLTMAVPINDNKESAWGDHIVLVLSYDRATGMLYTIGGNDGGYVVRQKDKDPPTGESPADKADRERREAATGQKLSKPTTGAHVGVGAKDLKHQPKAGALGSVTTQSHVSGIGRPSLVDYEAHEYYDKK
jgi:hypothetical protein